MKRYKVAFVWRFLTPNCGDLVSSPWNYLYFQKDVTVKVDISRDLTRPEILEIFDNSEIIIVGGGGLLGLDKYTDKINFIFSKYSSKVFIWGAGSNWPRSKPPLELPSLNNCYFSGVRDFPLSVTYQQFPRESIKDSTYLPCASSLDIYFLLHWKSELLIKKNKFVEKNSRRPLKILFSANDAGKQSQSFPSSFVKKIEYIFSSHFDCQSSTIGNSNIRMLSCLDAIQSADLVFTRSYHFAYWSFLLGKPVIAIPTSSKFNSFPLVYNKYLLFSSCAEILEFISASNLTKIEEFVFSSSYQKNIHFYLQSLLLNLGAAHTLYEKLRDNTSYRLFVSKYNELLKTIPAKTYNEIGVTFDRVNNDSNSEASVKTDSDALNIPGLVSLHTGPPLLAENAINKSIQPCDHVWTDYKVIALTHIRDTLNRQANALVPSRYVNKIKHKFKRILKGLLRHIDSH